MFELAMSRKNIFRLFVRLIFAIFFVGMAELTHAGGLENITDAEMQLLPAYCADTQTFKYGDSTFNTSPKAGHWVSLMGKSFWGMHHYCWALIALNRAQKASVSESARQGLWEGARADCGYVIKNSPPDFILLPEIYTRVGQIELLLKNPDKANEAFAKARSLKLDYWPAYSHWAEFLMKVGKRPEALKIVTSGLEYSPDAKVLLGQFRLLGGKPSDIPKLSKPKVVIDPVTEGEKTMPNEPLVPEATRQKD